MWLAYLFLPLILAGVVLLVVGAGPFAIVPIVIGVAVVAARRARQPRNRSSQETAEKNAAEGPGIGFAHEGQNPELPSDATAHRQ
jgi:hypothetical protein